MRAKARNTLYGLALIAVMLAVLAVTAFSVITGKARHMDAETQISALNITQLAEARMSARYLLSIGVCTIMEARVMQTLLDRIDEAVRVKRQAEGLNAP